MKKQNGQFYDTIYRDNIYIISIYSIIKPRRDARANGAKQAENIVFKPLFAASENFGHKKIAFVVGTICGVNPARLPGCISPTGTPSGQVVRNRTKSRLFAYQYSTVMRIHPVITSCYSRMFTIRDVMCHVLCRRESGKV